MLSAAMESRSPVVLKLRSRDDRIELRGRIEAIDASGVEVRIAGVHDFHSTQCVRLILEDDDEQVWMESMVAWAECSESTCIRLLMPDEVRLRERREESRWPNVLEGGLRAWIGDQSYSVLDLSPSGIRVERGNLCEEECRVHLRRDNRPVATFEARVHPRSDHVGLALDVAGASDTDFAAYDGLLTEVRCEVFVARLRSFTH